MLETRNLTKNYDKLAAVNNLNLNVANELFVFLGPNGAGKTTTIKMLTGLLRPSAGEVKIGNFDIWQQPIAAKRLLGLVPDMPFLYEKLSGREFWQFMADVYQVDRLTARKRIENLLALFELESQADQLIQTYSLGMKRKCALGGALIHDPRLLILDEPTSGLDPKSARNIKEVLRELVKRGVTVFMSTHILEIAESLCDRIGIIHQGQLVACGSLSELRATAPTAAQSLEEIFLSLTGGAETGELLKYLED
jgi:ABC-2 type transport system ATP-binding protein